ncbi:VWA domain-containing protein [Sphaerotilus mobilis]|uniref:Ca-activated chloride channel family protein n=1 Tax=Sphaerotilus mobilis TaxID=47994 RepID=A0A4Q7LTP0_9BURK|nr:VWA domain-containing protein [Sphaerotilus mobilis]RZS57189.1 Ca-activated chloride channel family protein [Sphaerotilus mobilis]
MNETLASLFQQAPVSFLWPSQLWLLLLWPLIALAYVWLLRRRKRQVVRVASLGLIRQAVGHGGAWRRHVPPILIGLALLLLLIGMARPVAVLTLPLRDQTLLLAMDVSGSMRATDVEPNRLVASQNAAKAFVQDLPRHVRVGVVSFAGTAAVVQAPTHSREDVIAAIDRFQLQRGTAIGSGIVLSLATLFPEAGIDLSDVTGERRMPKPLGTEREKQDDFKPVAPGSYSSAAVILLTDGQRTTGMDPMDAAKLAADRGVKVYTVGFGTTSGEIIGFEGWSMRVRLDEATLKNVANLTQAEYFYAGSATDLKKVYDTLSSRLVFERKETEVTALVAGLAGLLVLLACGLSVAWFGRVI